MMLYDPMRAVSLGCLGKYEDLQCDMDARIMHNINGCSRHQDHNDWPHSRPLQLDPHLLQLDKGQVSNGKD
jgi:hypothetical protein